MQGATSGSFIRDAAGNLVSQGASREISRVLGDNHTASWGDIFEQTAGTLLARGALNVVDRPLTASPEAVDHVNDSVNRMLAGESARLGRDIEMSTEASLRGYFAASNMAAAGQLDAQLRGGLDDAYVGSFANHNSEGRGASGGQIAYQQGNPAPNARYLVLPENAYTDGGGANRGVGGFQSPLESFSIKSRGLPTQYDAVRAVTSAASGPFAGAIVTNLPTITVTANTPGITKESYDPAWMRFTDNSHGPSAFDELSQQVVWNNLATDARERNDIQRVSARRAFVAEENRQLNVRIHDKIQSEGRQFVAFNASLAAGGALGAVAVASPLFGAAYSGYSIGKGAVDISDGNYLAGGLEVFGGALGAAGATFQTLALSAPRAGASVFLEFAWSPLGGVRGVGSSGLVAEGMSPAAFAEASELHAATRGRSPELATKVDAALGRTTLENRTVAGDDIVALARQRQAQMLVDDVGFNISPDSWDAFPKIGRSGTYVTDEASVSRYIGDASRRGELVITKSRAAEIERGLGLEPGSLNDGFKVRKITGIAEMNPHSPLAGNTFFRGPGLHLPDGSPEMVVDSVSTVDNAFVSTIIKVRVR